MSWAATANTDSYDVYFGTSTTPPLIGNVTSTSYPLSGLNAGAVYHWKVAAKNNCGNSSAGLAWFFTAVGGGIVPIPGTWAGSIIKFNVSSDGKKMTSEGSSIMDPACGRAPLVETRP